MQACIYDQYGSADVVRLGQVATPALGARELLVRVHASSVTTADWRFRASAFPGGFWLAGRLMFGLFKPRHRVLGMDFSGVVVAVGAEVTRYRVGDALFGSVARGAHAEYLAVPEAAAVAHKPAQLSHEQAAAVPFGANAALAFLRDFAELKAGQRVLIVGASGGVGVWAVQLARLLGAHVTAVCSSDNLELVRALGAERAIDYRAGSLLPAGERYDLIFDTVGVTSFASCRQALTPKGLYLPLNPGFREMWQATLNAFRRGPRVKFAISQNTRESLEHVAALIESGALEPVVDQVYPMHEIAAAHRRVEGRHKRGSVIVSMLSAASG